MSELPVEAAPDAVHDVLAGAPEPARKLPRRRLWIVLGAVAVLCVLAVGGVLARPVSDVLAQYPAHFAAPDKVDGIHRTEIAALREAEKSTVAKLRDEGVAEPFAVYYDDDVYDYYLVSIIGSTGFNRSPSDALDGAFVLAGGGKLEVTGRKDVDPGKAGGVMQCADGTYRAGPARQRMTICAWADHGSMGAGMFYGRGATRSADLMRTIRDAGMAHR